MTNPLTPAQAIEEIRKLPTIVGIGGKAVKIAYKINDILEKVINEESVLDQIRAAHLIYRDSHQNFHKAVLAILDRVTEEEPQRDPYPDTEADGYVYCGKCGAGPK